MLKVLQLKPKTEKLNSNLDVLVYTLKVDDEKKADKIKSSIPKEMEKHEINEKKGKKKEQKKK